MCIRDRAYVTWAYVRFTYGHGACLRMHEQHRTVVAWAEESARAFPRAACALLRTSDTKGCLLYTSDAADDM
eukprot:6854483-Prorocentrum_lima.AAC.1